MTKTKQPIILTFVGMPGSGKGTCVDYVLKARPNLPPHLYFGGIVVEEVKNRGLEVNEANEKLVRLDLRAKEGKEVLAHRIAKKIDELLAAGETRILVDGIYSWSEYKVFKQKYGDDVVVVAVTAPRSVRHERLANRPIRPLNADDADSRDYAEIETMEKGGPIANADYTINNGADPQNLYTQIDGLLTATSF